jgi:Flp pilus assembly protein TadD
MPLPMPTSAGPLFALRRFDEAVDTVRRAVQLAPNDPAVLGLAESLLGELGHDQESVALDHKAIRLSPQVASLHIGLAFGLRQLGQLQEAERALHDALRLSDRDTGAHTNLGEVYLLADNQDAARRSLLRAIELAPQTTMKAHVLLGVLQRVRDPQAARATFHRALRATDPYQSAFAACEMRAIALTALGNGETGSQLLAAARSQRIPSDTYRKPIYDLLQQPPLAGVELLLAIWQQIVTDDAAAACPFEPPRAS